MKLSIYGCIFCYYKRIILHTDYIKKGGVNSATENPTKCLERYEPIVLIYFPHIVCADKSFAMVNRLCLVNVRGRVYPSPVGPAIVIAKKPSPSSPQQA